MSEERIRDQDDRLGEVPETTGRTITGTDFVTHAGRTGDLFPHCMDAGFAGHRAPSPAA